MNRSSKTKDLDSKAVHSSAIPGAIPSDFLDYVLPKHARLTRVVQTLIGNVLNDEGIEFLSINGRTKDKKATLEKINRKSYLDPGRQLTDLTGIRVITYLDHQVRAISEIIRETFEVARKILWTEVRY